MFRQWMKRGCMWRTVMGSDGFITSSGVSRAWKAGPSSGRNLISKGSCSWLAFALAETQSCDLWNQGQKLTASTTSITSSILFSREIYPASWLAHSNELYAARSHAHTAKLTESCHEKNGGWKCQWRGEVFVERGRHCSTVSRGHTCIVVEASSSGPRRSLSAGPTITQPESPLV